MIIVSNGKTITLNDDQVGALQAIDQWYKSNKLFFTLSGAAGTGKTTIVKKAIEGFRGAIRISAPTHKACKVVARSTGMFSITIQSLCGLKPDTKIDDVNKKRFVPATEPKIRDYSLIVIDEASMLGDLGPKDKETGKYDTGILTLIMDLARQYRTKILFMGDVYQLPPVNEDVSKVFTHPEIEVFHLTKVERQKDSNPLMKIYDLIRSDIAFPTDMFIHQTALNDKGEGAEFFSRGEVFFKEVMNGFSSDQFKENPNHCKVLAFRNETVKAWNRYIRQQIFGTDVPWLCQDDVLMSYTSIYNEQLRISTIVNSAEYKITSIKPHQLHIEGQDIERVEVRLKDVDDMELERCVNIVYPDYENYTKFITIWHKLLQLAKKFNSWKAYYKFKEDMLLLEDIKDAEGKLLVKKDFDYAYALTVHKSQGSTYTNVFVDENDLDACREADVRNKLKYVAFSRPTTKAFILSDKTVENEGNRVPREESQPA